jgi:uncharacterized membrane protein YqaE (UPF0057 family)
VFLKSKSIGMTLLCLVLCFFLWVPGFLMAIWVVLKD